MKTRLKKSVGFHFIFLSCSVHNAFDSSSISDNFIIAILEDRSGNLWVRTFNGGLNRFDAKDLQRPNPAFCKSRLTF